MRLGMGVSHLYPFSMFDVDYQKLVLRMDLSYQKEDLALLSSRRQ